LAFFNPEIPGLEKKSGIAIPRYSDGVEGYKLKILTFLYKTKVSASLFIFLNVVTMATPNGPFKFT